MAGTHDIQRQDPAVGDSCNLQRQGHAVGTPCTQLRQDPAVGDPCMTRTQGPAVGSPCSPPSSIVRPMDGNHVSPLASLPYAQSSIEQWNDSYADDDSTTEENNPFAAMPGLEDCPLAGLRSALSKPVEHLTTSKHQKALWRQARGGTEVRQVKTFRSEALYADSNKDSPFLPPELPQDMPISQPQWTADVALRKQQRSVGITAAALSKGLDLMEAPMAEITEIAEA